MTNNGGKGAASPKNDPTLSSTSHGPEDRPQPTDFDITSSQTAGWVESRCGAVAVGQASLLPPLSVGGAQGARPWLRFHIPLIEPDVRYLRIRLSDKPSCLRPRKVVCARRQMNQPQYLIEVPVGEARRPPARHFVFLAQPSTQPLSSVGVQQVIRRTDGTQAEVICPAPKLPVQPTHNLFGIQQPRA